MTQEQEQFDQLPAAIVARLQAQERSVAMLTPAVDREIRNAAHAQFASRQSRSAARRWYAPAAAAAAVALIALFIARPFEEPAVEALRLADDIDGSGQVDILDAFALARLARDADDESGRGRIDALAERIVALDAAEAVL